MVGKSKPAASLSSSLLARKGHARPAMRPQGFIGAESETSLDDLGWNDMGQAERLPAAPPPVLVQRQALTQEFAAVAVSVPAPQPEPLASTSSATASRIGRQPGVRTGKAAFTLRLDRERHLKLRLASAVLDRSAQLIVAEALDAYLETLPEVRTLTSQRPVGEDR